MRVPPPSRDRLAGDRRDRGWPVGKGAPSIRSRFVQPRSGIHRQSQNPPRDRLAPVQDLASPRVEAVPGHPPSDHLSSIPAAMARTRSSNTPPTRWSSPRYATPHVVRNAPPGGNAPGPSGRSAPPPSKWGSKGCLDGAFGLAGLGLRQCARAPLAKAGGWARIQHFATGAPSRPGGGGTASRGRDRISRGRRARRWGTPVRNPRRRWSRRGPRSRRMPGRCAS